MRQQECYACVVAREFPVQALVREDAALQAEAVVVLEGKAPAEQVCSLNKAAAKLGLSAGMTKTEAELFGVELRRRSGSAESQARAALLNCLAGWTPRVEESRGEAMVCAFCMDLSGTERLFGTPVEIARAVVAEAKALGLSVQVGMSANFETAVLLGRSGQAKVMRAAAGDEAAALAGLPLSLLPLTNDQRETLSAWGLTCLGELGRLPEKELIARMGQAGRWLRMLARGEAAHHFEAVEAPFVLEQRVEFEQAIDLLEPLLFSLNAMLETVIGGAMERALAVATLEVRAGLEKEGEHVRVIRPAVPTSDRALLLKLVHLDLSAHAPEAGVRWLRVTAQAGPESKVQMGLFAPQLPEPGRLDVTLARLAALVGEERVGWAQVGDTYKADSFAMQRFSVVTKRVETMGDGACSAMRRMRPPVSVMVRVEGTRPVWFADGMKRYMVERSFGPWQQSGAWWSWEIWSVESWDVAARTPEGELLLCVLGNDRVGGQWRLDGVYD